MQTYRMDPLTTAERKRLIALWRENSTIMSLAGPAEVLFTTDTDPLGTWHQSEHAVVLSSSLIGNPHIDDVFLHEAAHACDTATRGYSEHDRVFRDWCRRLGVTEGFEKAKVRMEKTDEDRIIKKVRKLLALTTSPFENERTEAMKKAQALLAEHSLSLPDDDGRDTIYYVVLSRKGRYQIWESALFRLISVMTGCFMLRECRCETGTEMRAFGDLETAEAAGFFYEYFSNAIDNEKKKMKGKSCDMRSYLFGLVSGLIERIGTDGEASRALMLSEKRTKEAFRRIDEGKIRSRHSRITINPFSYSKGKEESRNIYIPPKGGKGKAEPSLISCKKKK